MSDYYLVVVDRGGKDLVLAHEGSDINKVYVRIGQMAMSTDIEQIIVHKNSEEYRRYELKRRDVEAANAMYSIDLGGYHGAENLEVLREEQEL